MNYTTGVVDSEYQASFIWNSSEPKIIWDIFYK